MKILNEVQRELEAKITNDRNFYADLMVNLLVEVPRRRLLTDREWCR